MSDSFSFSQLTDAKRECSSASDDVYALYSDVMDGEPSRSVPFFAAAVERLFEIYDERFERLFSAYENGVSRREIAVGDLETAIMDAWLIVDDLRDVAEAAEGAWLDHNGLANALLGLSVMASIRDRKLEDALRRVLPVSPVPSP